MAKYLISDDNSTYLKECTKDFYINIPEIFYHVVKDFPELEKLKRFLDSLSKRRGYVPAFDAGFLEFRPEQSINQQYFMGHVYTSFTYAEPRPSIEIGPKTRGPVMTKSYLEGVQNAFTFDKQVLKNLVEYTENLDTLELPENCRVIDVGVAKKYIANLALQIYKEVGNIDLKPIDFSKYKFKPYVNDSLSIDTVSPYYLFVEEGGGNFLALTKKRSKDLYEWSLCPNMTHAYLFTQPLDSYDLRYNKVTKVKADIRITSIEGSTNHPKLQEVQARIEKRDLSAEITSKPVKKSHKL